MKNHVQIVSSIIETEKICVMQECGAFIIRANVCGTSLH